MPATGVHAVVPVKDFDGAKQRLAGALDRPARIALFRAMLEDVLEALSGVASLAGILLVTRDPEAVALAGRYGAECLIEPENRGHTAAVELAARTLAGRGAGGLLQVPGDVPRVTVAEIEAVVAAHAPAPAVTIAPSRDRLGSNALLCSPPDVFPFRFGSDSFYPPPRRRPRHRDRAGRRRAAGSRPRRRYPRRPGGVPRLAVGLAGVPPPRGPCFSSDTASRRSKPKSGALNPCRRGKPLPPRSRIPRMNALPPGTDDGG